MRRGFTRIARAFLDGRTATLKNDSSRGDSLTYHGNTIARRNADGSIDVTLAGWNTVTTRSRLNQLAGMLDSDWRVYTKAWEPYARHWRTPDVAGVELGSRDWTTLSAPARALRAA